VEIVERNMSKANMQALPSCRGLRARHAQKEGIGSWESPRFDQRQQYALARIGKARSRSR
jgi:hypothetical protein